MNEITIIPADAVTVIDSKPMTTSLKIAEIFGKQHKNVIQAIEKLECSQNFGWLNFQLTEYLWKNNLGKEVKSSMYNLTKDGFVFLAMGFKGKTAAQFKETYITAFNRIEETLRQIIIKRNEHLANLAADLHAVIQKKDNELGDAELEFEERVDLYKSERGMWINIASEFSRKTDTHIVHNPDYQPSPPVLMTKEQDVRRKAAIERRYGKPIMMEKHS
ncbi:MAG: hypothetical protein A2020_12360 [Lentisphaerae bacterium GWF2_45_14]|nr:MAG: hypothetical protein A2020_12360 [Lentisphaerae bacterium GWF2_45_14]